MALEQDRLPGSPASLDDIIQRLKVSGNDFPEQAMRDARACAKEITPKLIQLLQEVTERAKRGDISEDNSQLFAVFLLAEFHAKEAAPAIIDSLSLPGEGPFDLFGDVTLEDFREILAGLATEVPELLDSMIRNREVDPILRGAVADVYQFWVRDGVISRLDAVNKLRQFLHRATKDRELHLSASIVSTLCGLYPQEALPDIRKAFQKGLIDRMVIRERDVQEAIEAGEEGMAKELRQLRPTGVGDAIETLGRWFKPASYSNRSRLDEGIHPPEPKFVDLLASDEDEYEPSTIHRTDRRVGRNESCPCGSGKKFKNCCLGRTDQD